jgi:hypothetical protein
MDTQECEQGKLIEALTLEIVRLEPCYPAFQCFSKNTKNWDLYGHWKVPPYWNNSNYMDVEYRNSDGKLHRIYGPAYISRLYNIQAWFKNGIRHRDDGPAYIHNANMVWFSEGELHNFNGPAVLELGGPEQYWIHGSRLSKKEFKKEINRRKRSGLIR